MTEEELFLLAPVMAEPPMATMKEMEDGTYSIEDVLKMNLLLMWKADQRERKR